jgi:alanine racemase
MHRLGFEEKQLPELFQYLQPEDRWVEVASVFTHLAGADEEQFNEFSLQQLHTFKRMADALEAHLGKAILRHAYNSAGIVRFHASGMFRLGEHEMVRLGIGLYGIEANGLLQDKLLPVGTLKTVISQIKHLPQGDSVSYSRSGRVERPTTIATLALGYADGYSRRFGRGVGKVLVNGQLAPIIGNVCMDMCMADITGIAAQEGDEVVVFGQTPDLIGLAKAAGTIPYELMTAVGERVKRVFFMK